MMMLSRVFKLLLCLVLFVSQASFATQRVVLLTSLDLSHFSPWYGFITNPYSNFDDYLQMKFYKYFRGTKYYTEVIHRADQFDLWKALHDPQNVAVFWLSHSGSSQSRNPVSALMGSSQIIDVNGFDLAPVFQKVHPNIRVLAVMGCLSDQVIKSIPAINHDPIYPPHPFLRYVTFKEKVEPKAALKLAVQQALPILDIPEIKMGYPLEPSTEFPLCPKIPGYKVQITRTFSEKHTGVIRPAVRVMSGVDTVGVLPKGLSIDSSQIVEVFIPMQARDKGQLPKILLSMGDNDSIMMDMTKQNELDFGKFKLTLKKEGQEDLQAWKVYGLDEPFGITEHLYNPKKIEKSILEQYEIEDREFECGVMPPY